MATRSVQELAQEMVDEIEQGIDGTDLKAGIIAEIGSSEGKITPLEEKVFIAAALAHNQTGRPISTHTSFSTMGLEQLALLQAHGVDLSRVTVGHCDLKDNLDNILKMIDLARMCSSTPSARTVTTRTKSALRCSMRYVTVGC